ncbi:ABC transporter permease [Ruicaihuangia caeni]|uniref:ABC transporter permease n=1 Tax=Ruicaihuangia caeni TaxID=3042517 RepID=A0AAW6TCL8_9MICO|nr:ABC transporter permease [Klugiella sp. YN-L-19]MDI2099743.1 ABC transporter permease [Klugiella sp. YN-L-19]
MASETPVVASPAAASPRRRPRRVGERLSPRRYAATAVATFVVLIAVWWAATAFGLVDPLFLPGPDAVVAKLIAQAQNGQLWSDIAVSVYRIFVGFLLATVMALPLGVLMGANAHAEAALEPLIDFVRYMPVVAFVPLTILWVGTDDAQKFLIIWIGTFFQQVLLIADAVRQVPVSFVQLGETLGMGRAGILMRIVFPSALPRIWDAMRICLGWAWTWLVVAELVAATSGMGYRIMTAQRFFATDTIIGYVLVLGLLGLVFDQVMRAAGRRMFRHQRAAS